jgi:tetratricopeptide (TPR) repeat protein
LGSEWRSFGQVDDLDTLSKQFTTLYGQGKYTEAATIAEQLLKLIEAARGPNDPLTAIALNNLGVVYNQEGKYPLAEQALNQALAIEEKALGLEHPDVAGTPCGVVD